MSTIKNKLFESIKEPFEEWMNDYTEKLEKNIQNYVIQVIAPTIQDWIMKIYTPKIEKWAVDELLPEIEKWCRDSFIVRPMANGATLQEFIQEELKKKVESQTEEILTETNK